MVGMGSWDALEIDTGDRNLRRISSGLRRILLRNGYGWIHTAVSCCFAMMGARGSINIAISETDVGMDKEIVQADTQQRVNTIRPLLYSNH